MIMEKQEAIDFFSTFYFGEHHFPSKIKKWGDGWCINHYSVLSTFDSDSLTRLVFLAHDKSIRVEITPVNFKFIRIAIHKRLRDGENWYDRHPSIEDALKTWRIESITGKKEGEVCMEKTQKK